MRCNKDLCFLILHLKLCVLAIDPGTSTDKHRDLHPFQVRSLQSLIWDFQNRVYVLGKILKLILGLWEIPFLSKTIIQNLFSKSNGVYKV